MKWENIEFLISSRGVVVFPNHSNLHIFLPHKLVCSALFSYRGVAFEKGFNSISKELIPNSPDFSMRRKQHRAWLDSDN